jgi:hypothetical protein
LAEREGKRCAFVALQDYRIEYCATIGDKTPKLGYYNLHASYRATRHPSALVGSFLAIKGTFGRAFSSVSLAIGMPASMVAPIGPPPMV